MAAVIEEFTVRLRSFLVTIRTHNFGVLVLVPICRFLTRNEMRKMTVTNEAAKISLQYISSYKKKRVHSYKCIRSGRRKMRKKIIIFFQDFKLVPDVAFQTIWFLTCLDKAPVKQKIYSDYMNGRIAQSIGLFVTNNSVWYVLCILFKVKAAHSGYPSCRPALVTRYNT